MCVRQSPHLSRLWVLDLVHGFLGTALPGTVYVSIQASHRKALFGREQVLRVRARQSNLASTFKSGYA